MKKILVPTDFSDYADAAAEFAIQLAQKAEIKVCFMHLEPTPVEWLALSKEQEKQYPETVHAISRARNRLKALVHKAEVNGVEAEHSLVLSAERTAVFEHLERHHYDLIILGSHGKKGLREKLMGSNALYILRNAKVPVIILKKAAKTPVKNVLFVSNFRELSEPTFHSVSQVAELLEAHLHLLLVRTDYDFQNPDKDLEYLDKVVPTSDTGVHLTKHTVEAPSVEEGIEEFLQQQSIDLIAIGTHGRSELKQLFIPSIAERVVEHSTVPVLSVRLG